MTEKEADTTEKVGEVGVWKYSHRYKNMIFFFSENAMCH